jgi:Transposase
LSALVIQDVKDAGEIIVVQARTGTRRVLGIDDFALRHGSVYATMLIVAETGRRIDVVPGRTANVAEKWLRDHPGVEVVCRDGRAPTGVAVPGAGESTYCAAQVAATALDSDGREWAEVAGRKFST